MYRCIRNQKILVIGFAAIAYLLCFTYSVGNLSYGVKSMPFLTQIVLNYHWVQHEHPEKLSLLGISMVHKAWELGNKHFRANAAKIHVMSITETSWGSQHAPCTGWCSQGDAWHLWPPWIPYSLLDKPTLQGKKSPIAWVKNSDNFHGAETLSWQARLVFITKCSRLKLSLIPGPAQGDPGPLSYTKET